MIHSARIGRWLGEADADLLAGATRGFYGGPIPVVGTPWASYRGDFVRNRLRTFYRFARVQLCSQIGGFASLSDLIAEATAGKRQDFNVQKVGVTGVAGVCNTLWYEGNRPAAGSIGAALPSGTSCDRTTTGALGQTNPTSGDTLHIISAFMSASVGGNCLLLYDRLWHGAPAMNSSAAQTITMTLPRYASYPATVGNFAFMEVQSALAATAHNNTITYRDENNNTAEAAPACAGVSGAIAKRFDHVANQWFIPLNGNDAGITQLTQYQCSAAVASGAMNLVVGHPLCFIPFPVANYMVVMDGINSAFNFVRVEDGACVAMIEYMKAATTATTYAGQIVMVSG